MTFCSVKESSALSKEEFAQSPQWLSIVHYQKSWGGNKGSIGSDNFYISPKGRQNPQKELEATIALFQSNDIETQCLFPARYQILKKNQLIDSSFPNCKEFEQFKNDLKPSGVTLLFTDAYMNNSSSLFGHTLIRVDTARKGTQLLAHGINYGAYTKGYENSFLYAVYGLAGFYPAGFTTKPYYDVINTYNNLENRDIWEYNLNLSAEELDLFVAHIWELDKTMTPYYFFTSNCSYMLMEVLDAVRPSLSLAKSFPLQTIPLDTIKVVASRDDLVKSVNYRPSRQRKINHRISQMSKAQKKSFLNIVKNDHYALDDLKDEEKADVLETAYQYVQYQYYSHEIALDEYRKKSFEALKRRNQSRSGQKFNELKTGFDPVNAHDSIQIRLAAGYKEGKGFQEIGLRPAYHALIDRSNGFLKGAEINFLDTSFRHDDHHDKYVFQNIHILELASLSPMNSIFKAPSYKIALNVGRKDNFEKKNREYYAADFSVGGGMTVEILSDVLMYALSSVDGAYGGALRDNYWGGIGFAGGVLINKDKWGVDAQAKKIFATSRQGSLMTATFKTDFYLSRNTALELSSKLTHNYNRNILENLIAVKQFF